MNRRIWAFFAALLISCTYILPPVPARAEDAGVLGAVDENGAGMSEEPGCGSEIPDAMVATPTTFDLFLAPQVASIAQNGLIDSYDMLKEQLDAGVTELELGAVITIPGDDYIDVYGESPIHIRTGEYGLIVEGAILIGENASISGDGVSRAVVELKNGGAILVIDSAFERAPSIVATENGGMALSFHSSGGYLINESSYLNINSNNGIGVRSETSLELTCCFIDAGSGRGIVGTDEVSLFLCRVEGGETAVDAPAVFADTSILVSGDESEYSSIRRTFTLGNDQLVLDIGEAIPDELYEPLYIRMYLSATGVEELEVARFINLNMPEIDTSEPGTYYVAIKTDRWMELCGLAPDEAAAYTIAVRDLRIPFFREMDSIFGYGHFFYTGADLDSLILWRSDDEGESWWDATDSMEFECVEDDLALFIPEIEEVPLWLVWEAKGIGESEILCVVFENGIATGGPGGDRSGIDRGENDPPPDDGTEDPPPDDGTEDPPPDDGTNDPPPDDGQPLTPPTNPAGDDRTATRSSGSSGTNLPDLILLDANAAIPANRMRLSAPQAGLPDEEAPAPARYAEGSSLTVTGRSLLAMMAANPNYVTLLHGGMSASIPTDYLQGLSITDGDSFSVYLTRPDEDSFSVFFSLNQLELDKPFTEPFFVGIPWDGGAVTCVSDLEAAADASLADGKAVFALLQMGTYRLMPAEPIVPVPAVTREKSPVQPPIEAAAPHPPVVGAAETAEPNRVGFVLVWVACCFALAGAAVSLGLLRKWRARQ